MRFVVIGGGTSGWLSALYLKQTYKNARVTVIASSEIGILGAGEGTTPHFLMMTDYLNIPASEIIKNAKATIKNGIKFTNWNGDGKHYYHPFFDRINIFGEGNELFYGHSPYIFDALSRGENLDQFSLTAKCSELNKVKLFKNEKAHTEKNPIFNYENAGTYALHFDAVELAKFFQQIANSRGIDFIDDEVTGFDVDEKGNIISIKTKSHSDYMCDFVFDCTGFKRKIIGEFYQSEWVSYKDKLPVDTAIPFFIENHSKEIPPYTESIAMKYGWMWKIPVQGRYGCGYVFDSSMVSEEEAKKELDEYMGYEVKSPRTFKFKAGCYRKTWINNCIAVGLSSGFIEPLEATSIWLQCLSLFAFSKNFEGFLNDDQFFKDRYNDLTYSYNEKVLNFLHMHYLTKRSDTDFWKNFAKNNTTPEPIKDLFEVADKTIPDEGYVYRKDNVLFQSHSYYHIGCGIKMFNEKKIQEIWKNYQHDSKKSEFEIEKKYYLENLHAAVPLLVDHYEFLESMKV